MAMRPGAYVQQQKQQSCPSSVNSALALVSGSGSQTSLERLLLSGVWHLRRARAQLQSDLRCCDRDGADTAAAPPETRSSGSAGAGNSFMSIHSATPNAFEAGDAERRVALAASLRALAVAEERAEAQLRDAVRRGAVGISFVDTPRPVPAIFSPIDVAALFSLSSGLSALEPHAQLPLRFILIVEKETVFQHLCRGASHSTASADDAQQSELEDRDKDEGGEDSDGVSVADPVSCRRAAAAVTHSPPTAAHAAPHGLTHAATHFPVRARLSTLKRHRPEDGSCSTRAQADAGLSSRTPHQGIGPMASSAANPNGDERAVNCKRACNRSRARAADAAAALLVRLRVPPRSSGSAPSPVFSVRMNALVVTSKGYPTGQVRHFLRALCHAHHQRGWPQGNEKEDFDSASSGRSADHEVLQRGLTSSSSDNNAQAGPASASNTFIGDSLSSVPVLCLVDADPYGIDIYCRYCFAFFP
jgi:hypothetical protein